MIELTETMAKAVAVGMTAVSIGSIAMVGSQNTQGTDHTINTAVMSMCDKAAETSDTGTGGGLVEKYISQAETMAKDDSIGYSQTTRFLNPNVDCSSFVWYALTKAGIKNLGTTPFATDGMTDPLNKAGFVKHSWDKKPDSLKRGDILWVHNNAHQHTEIYLGDGKTIGAHQDNDGKDGDSRGDEVSETALVDTFTDYFRMENAKTDDDDDTGRTVTAAATTITGGAAKVKGWTISQVAEHNTDGCTYQADQCTEWACVREHMFGHKEIHNIMGNGNMWVDSAVKLGWKKNVVAPGSIISWAPGSRVTYTDGSGWNADGEAGHVAVVESVDTNTKTLTLSEGGSGFYSGGGVNVNTVKYDPMPAGMSIAAPPGVTGDTSGDASETGVKDTDTGGGSGSCTTIQAADKDTTGSKADAANATYSGDGWHATPEQAKSIARQLLPSYFPDDHGTDQWEALEWIWEHESGWRWDATNPSSGAYGIPQSLPGDKMSTAGKDWHDNSGTQIKWGLQYIKERYGTPLKAQDFWKQHNWY